METKKFYWIKLKKDFLASDEVDFLLSSKNGCDYFVIYQMLCLMSCNSAGRLESLLGDIIVPYTLEKIQRETKYFSLDTIKVALDLLSKLNLVYLDNGTICISNYENLVGSESNWAKYKRISRAKDDPKKLDNVQPMSNKSQEYKSLDIKTNDKTDKIDKTICNGKNNLDPFLKMLFSNNYISKDDLSIDDYKDYFFSLRKQYNNRKIVVAIKYFLQKVKRKNIKNKFAYFKSSIDDSLTKDYGTYEKEQPGTKEVSQQDVIDLLNELGDE